MRLIKLVIENFKGIPAFTFTPDGQNVTVRGTNGAGKSTLYDAYCWLLFGKDSGGRADFDILPYSNSDALVSVTAELDLGADGCITLERTFARKIVRQKGTDEPSNKSEYKFFIDGVPKPKTAYAATVESICPAEELAILSDPDYFAGKLDWKKRRKILGELFGEVSDADLLQDEQWARLRGALGGHTVEDFRAIATAERRKIKAELDALPERINEAERAIPEDAPRDGDEERLAEIARKKEALDARKSEINNGYASSELAKEAAEKSAEIAERKAAYYARCAECGKEAQERADAARRAVSFKQSQIAEIELGLSVMRDHISSSEKKLTALREEYGRVNAVVWDTGKEICPACGQALPADRIDKMRAAFNVDKSKRIEENVAQGCDERRALDDLKAGAAAAETKLELEREKLAGLQRSAEAAANAVEQPEPFEETEEYKKLSAELAEIAVKQINEQGEKEKRLAILDEQLVVLCKEENEIKARIAAAQVAERQSARIEELRQRERDIGKRAAELDGLLDMAARFEQYRLTAIEKNVNDRFSYAKFKLFDQQINGGYSECCEVTVNDAPYSTNLNLGARVNAGLDIIRTLGEAYGFSAPVWIDNAESYVRLLDIDSQIIRLQVDASAENLTLQED